MNLTLDELQGSLALLDLYSGMLVAVLIATGAVLCLLAMRGLFHLRLLRAGIEGMSGLCLVSVALVFLLLVSNIHTYQRLTYEKSIANLHFTRLGPQHYRVVLENLETGELSEYRLQGDEWQLDARILAWSPAAQIIGLNALYRLDRLSGRYTDIEDEVHSPRTVHALGQKQGLDIWELARQYHRWLAWIDAYYGSAAYLPMHDGAEYSVSINQTGIIARPENAAAVEALGQWQNL